MYQALAKIKLKSLIIKLMRKQIPKKMFYLRILLSITYRVKNNHLPFYMHKFTLHQLDKHERVFTYLCWQLCQVRETLFLSYTKFFRN